MPIAEHVLQQQLQRPQLPDFVQHYPDSTERAAREVWTHGRFPEHLVAGAIARRDQFLTARPVNAAWLPGIKALDSFDWSWPKKVNRAQVPHRSRPEFLPHGNVILSGGVGGGETRLAIALAHTACLQGKSGPLTSAVDIVNALAAARATGGIKREMARLLPPSLLVINELGYLPIDEFGANRLFQLISPR